MAFQDQRSGGFRSDRQLYDITCSGCGQPAQVPFKPTPGRDVFCRACFQERGPRRDFQDRGFGGR